MSDLDLAAIKARLAAASPHECSCPSYYAKEEAALTELCAVHGEAGQELFDNAHGDLSALVAEVERLRDRIVTIDIDGRPVRMDTVAEAEAAVAAIEEYAAKLEPRLALAERVIESAATAIELNDDHPADLTSNADGDCADCGEKWPCSVQRWRIDRAEWEASR